jgi:DeoR/GlpR family transcriptional regulator of sugar metabolism
MSKIKNIKADLCILGANAIDLEHGMTDNDWDVVQLKQQMIESSRQTVCLTIAEKMNTVQPIRICDLTKIHSLITELEPDDPVLRPYQNAGIRIL